MKTRLLASALLAVLAASPVAANDTRSLIIEQVTVQHGDLDLATPEGADTMLGRLQDAASEACGGRPRSMVSDPLGPVRQRAYRLCRVSAIDAATLTLNAPAVRAVWLEHDEAVRFAREARQETSDLLRLARGEDTAAVRDF